MCYTVWKQKIENYRNVQASSKGNQMHHVKKIIRKRTRSSKKNFKSSYTYNN